MIHTFCPRSTCSGPFRLLNDFDLCASSVKRMRQGVERELPYVSSLPSFVILFIEASVSFFTGKMAVVIVPLMPTLVGADVRSLISGYTVVGLRSQDVIVPVS